MVSPQRPPWRTFQEEPAPKSSGMLGMLGALAVAVGVGALGVYALDYHRHTCDQCGARWGHFGAFNLGDEDSHKCSRCGQVQWWKCGAPHVLRGSQYVMPAASPSPVAAYVPEYAPYARGPEYASPENAAPQYAAPQYGPPEYARPEYARAEYQLPATHETASMYGSRDLPSVRSAGLSAAPVYASSYDRARSLAPSRAHAYPPVYDRAPAYDRVPVYDRAPAYDRAPGLPAAGPPPRSFASASAPESPMAVAIRPQERRWR